MTAAERRAAARTAVVWEDLGPVLTGVTEVLDIGGGTGGLAVRIAAQGPNVRVVDPSPDALAALDRRAGEAGVGDRISAQQGDLSELAEIVAPGSIDLVLCHGVLEMVDDPGEALARLFDVLRPGGALSLVVAQRHAAVIARAMAGHFGQALALLDGDAPASRGVRHRFTALEATDLVTAAGFTCTSVHGVRVFADLVPGSLLDLEPGSTEALAELESAASRRVDFLPLAAQIHLLAVR